MAKNITVIVRKHPDGWAVVKPNADRASAVCETQAEAIKRARKLAGGGPVNIQSRHGKFRKPTPYDK